MINEEEQHGLLDVIIRVRSPPGSREAQLVITDAILNQLVGNRATVNLPDAVYRAGVRGCGYTYGGLAVLLAGERHTRAMDGVATNNVEDLGIFLTWRLESFLAGWYIVEQIFDLVRGQSTCANRRTWDDNSDLRAASARARLWIGALSWLRRSQFSVSIVGSPGATRFRGPGGDCEMRDMTDTGQCFASKPIRPD